MEALVSNGIHFSLRGVQFLCTKIGAKKKKRKKKVLPTQKTTDKSHRLGEVGVLRQQLMRQGN
jgi:hypothetical protein